MPFFERDGIVGHSFFPLPDPKDVKPPVDPAEHRKILDELYKHSPVSGSHFDVDVAIHPKPAGHGDACQCHGCARHRDPSLKTEAECRPDDGIVREIAEVKVGDKLTVFLEGGAHYNEGRYSYGKIDEGKTIEVTEIVAKMDYVCFDTVYPSSGKTIRDTIPIIHGNLGPVFVKADRYNSPEFLATVREWKLAKLREKRQSLQSKVIDLVGQRDAVDKEINALHAETQGRQEV